MRTDQRPPTLVDNIAYRLAQFGPSRLRAHLDLFMGRFHGRVDWASGLGDGVYFLYGLVRVLRPEAVIEIGSARGKSTCAMALACSQNAKGKVYAIDPHTQNYWSDQRSESSYDFLLDRLRTYHLEPWCEVIRKTSREALANPPPIKADLVFIDGDHSYEGVKLDFELCRPLLSEHGLAVFHDSTWGHFKDHPNYREGGVGVGRYLEELRREGHEAVTVFPCPGLTVLQPIRGGFPYRAEG
jgi:predicted O-methyltransferase YrrM